MSKRSTFVGAGRNQLEDAAALQARVLARLSPEERSSAVNQAAQLLVGGKFEDAIAAYTAIAENDPSYRGQAEGQIGAAWFFLGEYEKALSYYRMALLHGADESQMKDNIEEAEAKLSGGGEEEEASATDILITLVVLGGLFAVLAAVALVVLGVLAAGLFVLV